MEKERPRVVVVGGGFAGLAVVKELKYADLDVVLVDRTNHHLFQPLLYQVATAALSPGDIAVPLRSILSGQKNVTILMDEAQSVDLVARTVRLKKQPPLAYDYLVLATGARPSYFGHPEWEDLAPGLKSLSDALRIREKILLAFEEAETLTDPQARAAALTFVIVGGGPTGVEVAGAIIEIGTKTLLSEYPKLRGHRLRVILIDGGSRILSAFDPRLSTRAEADLIRMGVEVQKQCRVESLTTEGVQTDGGEFIRARTVIWAAGNTTAWLVRSLETAKDSMGRAMVGLDLSLPDHPEVFVIGDAAHARGSDGQPLPGLAPVAMQQGRYVGRLLAAGLPPGKRTPFQYLDKGAMATIGRARAIAQTGGFRFSGFIAWLMWSVIHVAYLINFRNRFRVMAEWIYFYITFRPGSRIIYWQSRRQQKIQTLARQDLATPQPI
jgi:NADH dehydrogenase